MDWGFMNHFDSPFLLDLLVHATMIGSQLPHHSIVQQANSKISVDSV